MVELVLITHGTLAAALKDSAEMLVGEQEQVTTFGLHLGESVDELREEVAQAIHGGRQRGEVLVITDMVSGSPFNVASSLLQREEFEHLTGINFPIFLEILSARGECTAKELVDMALNIGRDTIINAKKYVEEAE